MISVSRSHRRLAAVVAIAVLGVGCRKAAPPTPPGTDPPNPTLTDEDYHEFGRKLEKVVAAGDKPATDRLFRMKDLNERADRELNLNLTPAEERGRRRSIERSGERMSAEVSTPVQNGGSYSFFRVHTVDGQKRVVMRLITPDGALLYHEILLARHPDGEVATHDIYDFGKGEMLSHLFQRLTLTIVAEWRPDVFARLTPTEQLHTKHPNAHSSMHVDSQSGRYKDALATFRALPAELQKDKMLQLLALRAAQRTSDDEYLVELERLRQNHPDDAAIDLWSLDYYLIKQKCDEVLAVLDRLDKRVGGDPYLSTLMSEALADAGRFPEARLKAEKAIKEAPKLEHAYWGRVTVATKEKNHADTLTWLKQLVEETGITLEPGDLEQDERFVEFVKSPEFHELKRWLAGRMK